MSGNSAANAAALAAFNGIGKKKKESTTKLNGTDNNTNHLGVIGSTSNQTKQHQQQQQQPQALRTPLPAHPSRKKSNKFSQLKRLNTAPAMASLQPALQIALPSISPTQPSAPASALDSDPDYFTLLPHTIPSKNEIAKSPQTPQDMIRNVRQSIELKAIPNNAQAKRLSVDYSPQEMLKNLRHSLHSRTKTSPMLTTSDKMGQTMLAEMRDRLENTRRIASNSVASLSLSPNLDFNKSTSDVSNLSHHYDVDTVSTDSFASFSSSINDRHLPHGISIDVTNHDSDEDEIDDREREEDHEPLDNGELKSTNNKVTVSSRLRRKPPPGEDFQMQLNDKSRDTISSGSYSLNPDEVYSFTDPDLYENLVSEVEVGETTRLFPQFPDANHYHQHSSKFRKKHQKVKPINGIYYRDMDLSNTSDTEESTSNLPLRSTTPLLGQPQQQVHFRSTMRKANTKKDKKSRFNELKPWKNHNDLNYLTDQEKKRYEGIWASNKGNYMSQVVIKLHGVNYETQKDPKEEAKMEHSRTAALLSAAAVEDSNYNGNNNLHNLDSVEINQLICGPVVKRIWKRSRLPSDTLEKIWNLIDFRRDGTLNKNEFLVGMWLVDQCLYGRKLPKKVDNVVWDSLGGIGVNVTVKKKK